MYPNFVSRKYLKEKKEKLDYTFELLEINNKNLPDKISDEDVERVRYAVKSYCSAILNEFGWKE